MVKVRKNNEVKTEELYHTGPETEWSTLEQFELTVKGLGRNEPVNVAIFLEDLRVEVKFQSNSELAGYLRKLFR